jgi:uncharacterized membrane protein YhaH (DUF805 family)
MLITVLGAQLDGWAALNLAVQFLLPLLVGLVTNKLTGRNKQFLLLGVLTFLSTVGAQAFAAHDAGQPINLVQLVVVAVVNFAVSLLSHYQVWKPTNITALMLATMSQKPSAPVAPVPDPSAPLSPASPVPALTLVPPAAA